MAVKTTAAVHKVATRSVNTLDASSIGEARLIAMRKTEREVQGGSCRAIIGEWTGVHQGRQESLDGLQSLRHNQGNTQ